MIEFNFYNELGDNNARYYNVRRGYDYGYGGGIDGANMSDHGESFVPRPVISITSNALLDKNITGQNGTEDNPYEIG